MDGGRVRRGNVVKAVLVAIIVELIGNAAGIVIGLASSRSTNLITVALTATAVSVVTGLALALLPRDDKEAKDATYASAPQVQYPRSYHSPQQASQRASSVPALTAVLIILIVLGIGGIAASYGIQKGFSYVRGLVDPTSEPGVQRLAAEKSASVGPLTLTVQGVEVNSRVTMVELTAINSGNDSVFVPLFSNCQLAADGLATMEADWYESDWAETIPPRGTIRGIISFDGPLEKTVTAVDLSFPTVSGIGVDSITVADIMLVPQPVASAPIYTPPYPQVWLRSGGN